MRSGTPLIDKMRDVARALWAGESPRLLVAELLELARESEPGDSVWRFAHRELALLASADEPWRASLLSRRLLAEEILVTTWAGPPWRWRSRCSGTRATPFAATRRRSSSRRGNPATPTTSGTSTTSRWTSRSAPSRCSRRPTRGRRAAPTRRRATPTRSVGWAAPKTGSTSSNHAARRRHARSGGLAALAGGRGPQGRTRAARSRVTQGGPRGFTSKHFFLLRPRRP